jgi:hypothetical protein
MKLNSSAQPSLVKFVTKLFAAVNTAQKLTVVFLNICDSSHVPEIIASAHTKYRPFLNYAMGTLSLLKCVFISRHSVVKPAAEDEKFYS